MSQQSLKQASIRAVTGYAEHYEGDWHRLFDYAAIPAGHFDERMLMWINGQLSTAYTNLPEAQQAFAAFFGAFNWSSLGTFDASGGGTPPPTEDGRASINLNNRLNTYPFIIGWH